jgi:hypothetical protein
MDGKSMSRLRLATYVLAVVAALGACSGAATPAVVQAPDLTLPTAVPLAASRTIPDTEVTLDPPGMADTSAARVSSGSAYALCGSGVAQCGPGTPAKVELARVTDPSWGGTSTTGGGLRQVLVWAFTWTGQQACAPVFGGLTDSTSTPATPIAADCQQVTLVDATTGTYIYSLQH